MCLCICIYAYMFINYPEYSYFTKLYPVFVTNQEFTILNIIQSTFFLSVWAFFMRESDFGHAVSISSAVRGDHNCLNLILIFFTRIRFVYV